MIAFLEGRLDEVFNNVCLVLTQGGVGYAVSVPAHTRANLPKRGEQLRLYTSLVVREDAMELFGFATFEERQAFELLVTISKVGAKTALAVLSIFRPQDLQRIVADDDPMVLTQVPGIGKKTAQHVFLELKDKWKGLPDVAQRFGRAELAWLCRKRELSCGARNSCEERGSGCLRGPETFPERAFEMRNQEERFCAEESSIGVRGLPLAENISV